jgi:hypothetical protein
MDGPASWKPSSLPSLGKATNNNAGQLAVLELTKQVNHAVPSEALPLIFHAFCAKPYFNEQLPRAGDSFGGRRLAS